MSEEEKPPFAEALRFLTDRERRLLADHPAPRDLTAYHAGELSPESEARMREHLALCRDCSDLLLDLAGFAKLKPPPGVPELTEEEIEEDWQAVRARLEGTERKGGEVVPIRPAVATPVKAEYGVLPWKRIAAALAAVSVALGLWVVMLTRDPSLKGGSVAVFDDAEQVRGSEEANSMPSDLLGVFIFYPSENYSAFEGEIVSGDKRVWRAEVSSNQSEPGKVTFYTLPGVLKVGEYEARLYGFVNGRTVTIGRIPFAVHGP